MGWSKLSSLSSLSTLVDITQPQPKREVRPLVVKPTRRTYLRSMDVVYDYAVGHPFMIITGDCHYAGCVISILDRPTLWKEGYTELHIRYNVGMAPTIISLDPDHTIRL